MVKIARVPPHPRRHFQYLEAEARAVDGGFTFRLYGSGARKLGLHGQEVDLAGLENLAAGRTPDGRARLGRRHRHGRWGLELLLHVPSTVGKAAEVLSDQDFKRLQKAIEKAVHDTVKHLEKFAARTRVTENKTVRREPVGLVYVPFFHATNRRGEASPHYQVVVFGNGARSNGQWGKLENRHLYQAQKSAHRVFNQALAYHIGRDLGLKVVRNGDSIRIQGIDDGWATTRRREDVKRERERTGRTDARGSTRAAFATREPKPTALRFAEVRRTWREAAHASGRYFADLGRRAWAHWEEAVHQRRADKCYRWAATAVAGNATRFPARSVDEVAAFLATPRNVQPDALARSAQAFRDTPKRYGAATDGAEYGQEVYTSAVRDRRRDALAAELARMAGRTRGGMTDRQIAAALAGTATAAEMAAVSRLTARQVVAGESHRTDDPALARVIDACRRRGRPVLAVTEGDASRLGRQLGVEAHSTDDLARKLTRPGHLESLWAGIRHGRGNPHARMAYAEQVRRSNLALPKKCVVVVDAGLDRPAELSAVVKAVRRAGGQLLFTGPHSESVRARIDELTRSRDRSPDGPSQHLPASRARTRGGGR